jgi:beta-glucoside operon transcriptional antiterminator
LATEQEVIVLLIKKINNNFVLALDDAGNEIIANGKGMGFKKMPCELKDLSEVERTFYHVEQIYSEVLSTIPEEVCDITTKVMAIVEHSISDELNPNLFFILADHINFCIERKLKGIRFDMPLQYELLNLYPIEVEIGQKALRLIYDRTGIWLNETEAYGIAMNIINARIDAPKSDKQARREEELIDHVVFIVEDFFKQKIDRNDFNYSRFAMHVHYLLLRLNKKESIFSINKGLAVEIREEYPEMWQCSEMISEYLKKEIGFTCNEEEKLYILLHINRMLSRASKI